MEGCPAALIEGPCEVLMWFFALPGMKTSCRRWHSLPRGWHSWGTLAGLAWSQSSLCAVPPKSWDHEGVPLLQQPLGQTGPGSTAELSGTAEAGAQPGFPLCHQSLAEQVRGRRAGEAEQCGDEGANSASPCRMLVRLVPSWELLPGIDFIGQAEALSPKYLKIAVCRLLEKYHRKS